MAILGWLLLTIGVVAGLLVLIVVIGTKAKIGQAIAEWGPVELRDAEGNVKAGHTPGRSP